MAVLVVPPYLQFFDANGIPLAGGLIYTYAAGTNTPQATYTDNTEAVQAANPVVLDSAGRATIWGNGSYKFVVKDALGNTIDTTDNVTTFSVPASSAMSYFQSFSGDGSTKTFSLSQSLGTDSNTILVFIDQGAGKGYDAQNPNTITLVGGGSPTITFASAPAVGTNNIYIFVPSLLLGAASGSAAAAASSATAAANSAILASQWASQTSGIVAATDFSAKAWAIGGTGVTGVSGKGASKEWATLTSGAVDTADYSAKAYAIGGTGVTGAAGAAKEWATKTSATVDGSTFSAKEFAQGTQAATGGSAKNWAQQTGADVTGAAANSRSAKSWAQDNNTGATLGGSAKDWAQTTGGTVDGTNYAAKEHAIGTTVTTGSAKDWATKTSAQVASTDTSAKGWAIGATGITDGAAKNWAQQTGADVTGAAVGSRSAKSWAQDNLAGATYNGSAKDWAQSASLPDGVSKSAKSYAADASTSATAAASSATAAAASATAAASAVVGLANEWNFATSTTMADPGTGNIRFNNATIASVTSIAISALSGDAGNPNLRSYIDSWANSNHAPSGTLKVVKNSTNFAFFGITYNTVVDNTTWLQFSVTLISSVGSFSASDALEIAFIPSGTDGTGTLNASGTPTTGALTRWASSTSIQNADLSGDVTTSGSTATVIAANAVTSAKFRQGAALSVVGVTGNTTANVSDIAGTASQVLRVNNAGTALAFGAVDLSQSAAATGVLQAASMPALTGDVTNTAGALATTIAANAVTNAKMATMAANTVKANATNASATPTDIALAASQLLGMGSTGNIAAISLGTGLSMSGTTLSATGTAGVVTVKKQVFTSSGTYTPSTGMLYCIIECIGGGGAGGGLATSTTTNASGGGGGGSYSRTLATAATVGVSKTVTIGAGGLAGSTGNNPGGNGGDTSVGTLCVGKGGTGGSGAATSTGSAGGAGGVAGTGDVTAVGANGFNAVAQNTATNTSTIIGGNGGNGPLGGGGGLGALKQPGSATGNTVGGAGSNYGAGGGGSAQVNNGATSVGGVGAQGIVIITEYNSQ